MVKTLVTTSDGLVSCTHQTCSSSSNSSSSRVVAACTKASYSPSLRYSTSPSSRVIITLVFLHSKDLCPWAPHLKHVMLLDPVEALEDMVDGDGLELVAFMAL